MTLNPSLWQTLPPTIIVGIYLGILGAFYLMYAFRRRPSEILHRCVFILSAEIFFVGIQLISYILFIVPQRHVDGNPPLIRYTVLVFSVIGLMMLIFFSSARPQSRPLGIIGINWLNAIGSMALSGVGFVGIGAVAASPDASSIIAIAFALPGILVMGLLNGCSPTIQWWISCLPRKCIVVIGGLMIFCTTILLFTQLLIF